MVAITSPHDLRRMTGAGFTVSDEQWAAISAPLAPTVVIAGAGSGKTELMAARVVYLVANELVRPDQVLGLTFTTKATSELAARIRTALAKAGLENEEVAEDGSVAERLEPTIATYNAYGAGLLTEHGLRIGHEPDRRLMADAARFQLAQRVIADHRGVVASLSDHPPTVIGYLLALESAMSEHLVGIEDVRAFHRDQAPRFSATVARLLAEGGRTKGRQDALRTVVTKMAEREELLGLVSDYRALKDHLGLMDFSDQIAGAHRLATQHPSVGRAERERFRVVLLDEYQDTSVAQARLLQGLFSGAAADDGRGHAVMAVGDPNQAIYGWRGASVANIEQFRDDFPRSDGSPADLLPLTVNRRSDERILGLANALADDLYRLPGAVVRPLVAKPDAGQGQIRTALHSTHDDELAWLTDEVERRHAAGTPYREIGVLVRTNKHGAQAYEALSQARVPVEIVGLGGLIRLPEVAQVVATLSLLDNVTDNAALLTLLTGPRWEIGPRDLALLGERSATLARVQHHQDGPMSLADQVQASVSGADPTEIASLNEALEDPGELGYSAQALDRFRRLSTELTYLRGFAGEPLLDLMRRIMDVTGLDTELASSTSAAAQARRDNLDLFVKAVADFQAVDGGVTLGALNAWLDTEDDYGGGLDVAPPSASDTVKLLTVHRAKGLEYDVVFLIGVGEKKFPNTTLRPQWTTSASVLPSALRGDRDAIPQLDGHEPGDLQSKFVDKEAEDHSLETQARSHQEHEELRLGYVAYTRARHEFVVSSHVWAEAQKPIAPSPYLTLARRFAEEGWGAEPEVWHPPEPDAPNPVLAAAREYAWPVERRSDERERRARAAQLVHAAADDETDPIGELSASEREVVRRWDEDIERLLAEARAAEVTEITVPLPSSLSATSLTRLRDDPDGFARDLARPMPRPPAPQARFGTRFHAWVEARFGQQQLLDPDDLPGRADSGISDDADLRELQERFEAGQFADRLPHAVEAPFSLVLAGQVVRGRIDAIFLEGDGSFLVVDWKTNRHQTADPLQLAIYRLAWAELQGVPVEQVAAGFYYVRDDELVRPSGLADRAALETLLDTRDR